MSEYKTGSLSGEQSAKLREDVMLASNPHPGKHIAGILIISLWHKGGTDEATADVLVDPSAGEQRKEVLHAGWHIITDILETEVTGDDE